MCKIYKTIQIEKPTSEDKNNVKLQKPAIPIKKTLLPHKNLIKSNPPLIKKSMECEKTIIVKKTPIFDEKSNSLEKSDCILNIINEKTIKNIVLKQQKSDIINLENSFKTKRYDIFGDFNEHTKNDKNDKIPTFYNSQNNYNLNLINEKIDKIPLFDTEFQFEIEDIMIGHGSFGSVFKIFDKLNKKTLALKMIEVIQEDDKYKIYTEILKEIEIMKNLQNLKSENILKFHQVFKKPRISQKTYDFLIIMELCECNLQEIIEIRAESRMFWTENQLIFYFNTLFNTLREIHKGDVVHRDIKPRNILYKFEDFKLKYADFGESKMLCKMEDLQKNSLEQTIRGTPFYMSPEIYSAYRNGQISGKYNAFSSDLYSLGIMFLMMKTLKKDINREEITKISEKFKGDSSFSSQIIIKLLDLDEKNRFMNSLLFEILEKKTDLPNESDILTLIRLDKEKIVDDKGKFSKLYMIASLYHKLLNFSKSHQVINEILENSINKLENHNEFKNILLYKTYFLLGRLQNDIIYNEKDNISGNCKFSSSSNESFEKAYKILTKDLIMIFPQNIYKNEYGDILNELGIIHKNNGNKEQALNYYQKSLKLAIELYGENSYNAAATLHNIGGLFLEIGEIQEAKNTFLKSIKITKKIRENKSINDEELRNLDKELSKSLKSLGTAYLQTEDYELAHSCFEDALGILVENEIDKGEIYQNLGYLYMKKKEFTDALINFQKQMELIELSHEYGCIGECFNNIGLVYCELNNHKECEIAWEKAILLAKNHDLKNVLALSYYNLGNFYYKIKDSQKGEDFFLKSVEIFENNQLDKGELGNLYYNLAVFRLNLEDNVKAQEYLNKSLKAFESVDGNEKNSLILNIRQILEKIQKFI